MFPLGFIFAVIVLRGRTNEIDVVSQLFYTQKGWSNGNAAPVAVARLASLHCFVLT